MSCGFRESGIGSNNTVAIRINIKLDVPVGLLDEKNKDRLIFFVSKRYISILDKLTVSKFIENKKKMDELYNKIDKEIISVPLEDESTKNQEVKETKEERRERKRKEGLERQRKLQSQE